MRRLSDVALNQKPLIMRRGVTVHAACQQMSKHNVGSVLVTDEHGALVGIFTGRDAVARVLAQGKDGANTLLKEVMTANPVTMAPEHTALDALRLMWDGGFRHLPVVKGGAIVGIVSRGDFKGYEQDRFDEERDLWEHLR
jgi:CBS domain-containing protein